MHLRLPGHGVAVNVGEFMRRVTLETGTDCWLWNGGRFNHGYGLITIGRKNRLAHRFAYEFFIGDPGSLKVCHKCDVKLCVNPKHLFLGTQGDNNRDRKQKGRNGDLRGVNNGRAKLTEADVVRIRSLSGLSKSEISRRTGIGRSQVRRILSSIHWKHLNGETERR